MGGEQGTVVAAEDDPNIADLVDMYLRREGYRVLQTADGASGIELVGEVVARTAEGFRPAATAAGVALTGDLPKGPALRARADAERLAQVVANLVENALKFACSRISVEAVSSDDAVVVSVVDDGPGIDPSALPHVFGRPRPATTITPRLDPWR